MKQYIEILFFFGDHWDPNETIPTGFAQIADFKENPPIFYGFLFWKKKNGFVAGVEFGGFVWWSLGPQWTHSDRFRLDTNFCADCLFWSFVASSIWRIFILNFSKTIAPIEVGSRIIKFLLCHLHLYILEATKVFLRKN